LFYESQITTTKTRADNQVQQSTVFDNFHLINSISLINTSIKSSL